MLVALAAIVIAYLFGSISSAVVVCKVMGLPDPRTEGSKNPGATNVLRLGGKKAALITLLGDALKGFIPVLIGYFLGFNFTLLTLIAFFAFLGHLFPIFFGFEGGKGVATFIGGLFALSPLTALVWCFTWLLMAGLFRYSSLAALTAAIAAPVFFSLMTHQLIPTLILSLMSILLIYRHKTNIKKLIAGEESKIGKK